MQQPKDNAGVKVQGSVVIRDPDTNEVLLKKSLSTDSKGKNK